jgi:hypothetical protein
MIQSNALRSQVDLIGVCVSRKMVRIWYDVFSALFFNAVGRVLFGASGSGLRDADERFSSLTMKGVRQLEHRMGIGPGIRAALAVST